MEITTYANLNAEDQKLIDAAEAALERAYNPYSKIYIGTAVLDASGKITAAANIATASSTSNLCAERAVIATANALGFRNSIKLAIIVGGDGAGSMAKNPVNPCGVCLQFLSEVPVMSGEDLEIISSNADKTKIEISSVAEFLPFPYAKK